MRDGVRFLFEFLSSPRSTGAIWPSSARLARTMVDWIDWSQIQCVIEYGPGTGVFTKEIVGRLPSRAMYLGIEYNTRLANALKGKFPDLWIVNESVADVREVCSAAGVTQADAIICGLPWAAFSAVEQDRYLDAMMTVLRTGGKFATFAYLQGFMLPSGQRFRRAMQMRFSGIARSDTVWANVPPAFVYQCTL